MKKLLGFFVFAFFAVGALAENNDRTMAFSISPIAAIFGGVDVMYQMKVTDFMSVTVPGNFYYSWGKGSLVKFMAEKTGKFEQTKAPFDAAIGLGARFLLAKHGLSDTFYVEPRVYFGYEQIGLRVGDYKIESETMRLTPMLKFGWDWYYDSGFYISLGAGIGMHAYFNHKQDVPADLKKNWASRTILLGWFLGIPPEDKTFSLAAEGEFKLGFAF